MSRTPRTTLLVLLAGAMSLAAAATASARPWPGNPAPAPEEAAAVDQAVTGASPLWHFLVVAAVTSLLVGTAAYLTASRRPDRGGPQPAASAGVAGAPLG